MADGDGAIDITQLTEVQQQALQQFTSVTDQELDAALPLLRRSQWNVQIAIAKFFDGEGVDPVAEARAEMESRPPVERSTRRETLLNGSTSYPSSRASSSQRDVDLAPRIVPQPESQVNRRSPLILTLLLTPFHILYRLFSTSWRLFSYLFPFMPRLFSSPAGVQGRPSSTRDTSGRRSLSPRDTAARFAREFEEEYGAPCPPFFEGGYAQALDQAKQDLKFLIVILISPEHDETASFIRDTLLAPNVFEYLNDPMRNVILWAGSVQDSEAYQVSNALNCTKFPFTAVIAHTPDVSATAMSVVSRIAGPASPMTFLMKIQKASMAHSEALDRVRAERTSRQSERDLREEQNSAYERSLAQDRERARIRRETEEAKTQAERDEKLRIEAALRYEKDYLQWRKWRAQRLLPEMDKGIVYVTTVSVRLPSGERIIRRFDPLTPVEELYAWVECYDVLVARENVLPVEAGGEVLSDEELQPPEGFEHKYGFRLFSPIPRQQLDWKKGDTLGEILGRNASIMVEIIDPEEEESSGEEDAYEGSDGKPGSGPGSDVGDGAEIRDDDKPVDIRFILDAERYN